MQSTAESHSSSHRLTTGPSVPPHTHIHRMVCFPYAGGNSNFYKTWDFKDTEMILVELPGRNAYVQNAQSNRNRHASELAA